MNGVPMRFVHVVPWLNGLMLLPQIFGDDRVAFEVYDNVVPMVKNESKHLAGHLDDERIGPEGIGLNRSFLLQAVIDDTIFHFRHFSFASDNKILCVYDTATRKPRKCSVLR